MASNIFSIGQSALAAAQAAQATTSHNISNATVVGYNRQVVVQSSAGGVDYGYGFLGQGTQVTDVTRVYNDFLNKQVLASQTSASSLDSYYSQISQLNNTVADTSAGLSPALQSFFSAMQNLANTPNNEAARQAMLSAGQTLAGRFQSLNDQLSQSRTAVNSQITSSVDSINSYAKQIQELNTAIQRASGAGGGSAPNDLLDQRDQAIANLNKIVKVTTVPQDNGSLSVFIGTGQPLVLGDQVSTLVATPAVDDPTRLQVSYQTTNSGISAQYGVTGNTGTGAISAISVNQGTATAGTSQTYTFNAAGPTLALTPPAATTVTIAGVTTSYAAGAAIPYTAGATVASGGVSFVLAGAPANGDKFVISTSSKSATTLIPDSAFTGGSLGGIMSYRTETLDTAQNNLGRIAIAMASSFNTQHKLGQDQNGAMGTDFFTVGVPSVIGSTNNHTTAPVPTATASIVDPSKLSTSDYRLSYDGANYTITRLSDNNKTVVTAPATMPVTVDGVTINASNMAANDSFLIKPTINGASSFKVALASTQNIATAAPIVTGVTKNTNITAQYSIAGNTGTGAVSGISVNQTSATAGATQTYTYTAGTNSLALTPVAASSVTIAGVTTNYAAGATIPYTAGATISSGGVSFVLGGAPANGDKFVLTTPSLGTGVISAGKVELDQPGPPPTSSFTQLPAGSALNFTYNGQTKTLTPTATAPATMSAVIVTHADGTTTPYAAGAVINFASGDKIATAGFSFSITGQPSDGDVFAVAPNTNGVSDNRNAQALNALQTTNTIGNTTYQGSYSQLVSFIGNKTNEINVTNSAEKARLTAIQQEQQSESGVNQDEELSNMIKNQTAYQAAAKIIQAASDMLNVLFTLGG